MVPLKLFKGNHYSAVTLQQISYRVDIVETFKRRINLTTAGIMLLCVRLAGVMLLCVGLKL